MPEVKSIDLAIDLKSLTKVYGNGVQALDHLSMRVRRGEIYGLLGPNGAGKSTLIKCLTGLVHPTHCRGTVLGFPVGDPEVKVAIERRRDGSKAPELTDEIMKPVRDAAKKMWPGVPVAPLMTAGATDGRFLMNAGIPTYGMSGMFSTTGETNAHGLNEKIRVKSLYEGRDFLESVVRAYVR